MEPGRFATTIQTQFPLSVILANITAVILANARIHARPHPKCEARLPENTATAYFDIGAIASDDRHDLDSARLLEVDVQAAAHLSWPSSLP